MKTPMMTMKYIREYEAFHNDDEGGEEESGENMNK